MPGAERVRGRRALIEFTPGIISIERLCAGVVVQLEDGTTDFGCAIDAVKAEHAFGSSGKTVAAIAQRLCASLATHWLLGNDREWKPPFEGARIARLQDFTARSVESAIRSTLARHSSIYKLLDAFLMVPSLKANNIVQKVKQAVRANRKTEHLARRFSRNVSVAAGGAMLRVDFLGQNYACYFVQVTESVRGIEASTDRACSKLFELQALRRFVRSKPKQIGLLPEERPGQFELVLVGSKTHPVQRQVLAQIEALAYNKDVIAKPLADVPAAADHVAKQERRAA